MRQRASFTRYSWSTVGLEIGFTFLARIVVEKRISPALQAARRLCVCFVCVTALCAQGIEELVSAGDALDEKNRNSEALGEKQRAREQLNTGLSLPSTEKDDENNKQRARASLKQLQ